MSETAKDSAIRGAGGLRVQVMRSQLGRVRGLGAAGHGSGEWWTARITSLALIPLTLWFIYAAYHLAGLPRANAAHWIASPVNATLMVALVGIVFHHSQAGLQVVIDDYIHREATRMTLMLANKGIAALLGLASVIAVLKLAFTG